MITISWDYEIVSFLTQMSGYRTTYLNLLVYILLTSDTMSNTREVDSIESISKS